MLDLETIKCHDRRFGLVRGFTLIEMLITLIVVAIAATLAMPALRDFNMSGAATAQANSLLANLNSARMEAVKSATNVRVSALGSGWSDGWVVAIDRDRSGTVEVAQGDRVFIEAPAAPPNIEISATLNPGAGAVSSLYFGPTGEIVQPVSGIMFILKRTDPDATPTKCKRVAVALSGRAETRSGVSNPCT